MVDVNQIKELIARHYDIYGKNSIDPVTGIVDSSGDVKLRLRVKQMPVKFGHVDGSFDCSVNNLSNLENAPVYVGKHFSCQFNRLINLDGAPSHVGKIFRLDYSLDLPLLRLLQYQNPDVLDAPDSVTKILEKYAGTGKKGMLGAGVELTRAGYKGNARW
jgi:hypothetical protein